MAGLRLRDLLRCRVGLCISALVKGIYTYIEEIYCPLSLQVGTIRCLFGLTVILFMPTVHFIARKRILLRDRRGVPYGSIQPYGLEQRSPVLSICTRSSDGRFRSRRR